MALMTRRRFLAATAALWVGRAAAAPTPGRVHRIGILAMLGGTAEESGIPAQMRKLGYEEGRNCVYEFRTANRQRDRLPGLAAELVAARVDVIVAYLPPEILAARRATSSIPIVMVFGMVPKELGLVESLGRPGGNVTGTLIQGPEWAGKYVQIARDFFGPRARLALLYEHDFPGFELYTDQMRKVGTQVGLDVERWPIYKDDDVQSAMLQFSKKPPAAFSFAPTGPILRQLKPLMAFASERHLAGICTTKWPVEHFGALFAYEPDLEKIEGRAMAIVDKILQGANPAQIPVEQPTHYELWINGKTTRRLGIKVPESVLVQTTRLIE
jgi:putative tryptophan/tyrosine transport system substrate-binding protein